MLKVWYVVDHDIHYPVGGASIVVAPDEATAMDLLDVELRAQGLKPNMLVPYTLVSVDLSKPGAYVLDNGDY